MRRALQQYLAFLQSLAHEHKAFAIVIPMQGNRIGQVHRFLAKGSSFAHRRPASALTRST